MFRKTKILPATMLLYLAAAAQAESGNTVHPFLTDKYMLEFGAFLPKVDLTAGVNGSASDINPEFDFENQFGVSDSDDLASADFGWRFHKKWSLHLQYFETGRSATSVLQQDVEFGDATFEQGSSVTAGSSIDILRLFFGREFSKKDNVSYGFGAGLHRLGLRMSLSGDVIVNGQTLVNETRAKGATAPLPDIGTWYYWSPSANWLLGGRVDWLAASLGDYDGSLLDVAVGVDYQISKHFGVGAKYQRFALDLDIDKTDWHGSIDISFSGAFIYLSANWN
jgi:hypothetical protein